MDLKDYLLETGWEKTKLPWNFKHPTLNYRVVELEKDSWEFPMYSIVSTRYDTSSFRGRIFSPEEFELIFSRIREDYDLEENQIEKWKSILQPKRV